MTTQTQQRQFRGGTGVYTDIAVRGPETMGIQVNFGIGLGGRAGLIFRFVVRSETGHHEPYQVFTLRYQRGYRFTDEEKMFNGASLNKFGISLMINAPQGLNKVDDFAEANGLWNQVGAWLTDQIQNEGFSLIEGNLGQWIRAKVMPKFNPPSVALVFPDLAADGANIKQMQAEHKTKKTKVSHGWADDSDEDADDKDEDDEDTLN